MWWSLLGTWQRYYISTTEFIDRKSTKAMIHLLTNHINTYFNKLRSTDNRTWHCTLIMHWNEPHRSSKATHLTEHLTEHSIVQVRVLQSQPFSLIFRPHHESVHRPPDPWFRPWFSLARAQGHSSGAGWVRASRPGLRRSSIAPGSWPRPSSRAGHRHQLRGPAVVKTMPPVRARSAGWGTPCSTLHNLAGLRTGLLTTTRLRYIHSNKTSTVKARCFLWIAGMPALANFWVL